MLPHTDLDERRSWSVNEYVSSRGNPLEASKILIAASKANLYTSNSSWLCITPAPPPLCSSAPRSPAPLLPCLP